MDNPKLPIILNGNNFKYETEAIVKLFIPAERFDFTLTKKDIPNLDEYILTEICETENEIFLKSTVKYKNRFEKNEIKIKDKSESEYELCRLLSDCLKKITGINPPWGIMTGIRPVKKAVELLESGKSENDARNIIKEKYEVSPKKLDLMFKTAENQIPILKSINKNAVSLYISIPFCPTRCSYCSFISHSIDSAMKLIPDYIDCLCKEIVITSEIIKNYDINVDTIYFGGGTPTSISAENIRKIMETVEKSFNLENIREYNFEAGRADTITEEKLRVIKAYGVNRISINPQTFNDEVLKIIGRCHTAKDTVKAYEIARKLGFSNINMDLIAGLPTETTESFKNSVEKAIALDPESITVHTLTLKRSGNLYENGKEYIKNHTEEMIDYSIERLTNCGYNPYYLYRQKNTLDNLENVGYSKKGYESFYNIYIMDETQTIIGTGCSASTKLVTPDGKISRIRNYKFPYEYINRFDELIRKKGEISECLKKISSSKL